jgi:hypothetical protein
MNGQVHWNPVAVIAVIAVLVAGYWLLPSSGWGRIGRGAILCLAVLIVAMLTWITVATWRIR